RGPRPPCRARRHRHRRDREVSAPTTTSAPATGTAEREVSLWQRLDRHDVARTAFVAVCTLAVALGARWPWPEVPLLAVIGLVVGCWPVLREAWEDVRNRRM